MTRSIPKVEVQYATHGEHRNINRKEDCCPHPEIVGECREEVNIWKRILRVLHYSQTGL